MMKKKLDNLLVNEENKNLQERFNTLFPVIWLMGVIKI